MNISRNLGNLDRMARFVIGALLVALAAFGAVGAWGFVGVILLGTAFVNFCPIYKVIGLKTCQDC